MIQVFFLLLLFVSSTQAKAQGSFGFGIGAFEVGDDNLNPSFNLDYSRSNYRFGYHFYGRHFGPVVENTHLVQIARAMPVNLGPKNLEFVYGISLLSEVTRIRYSDPIDIPSNRTQEEFNIGILLGLRWQVFAKNGYYLDLGWESSIYPAGLAAIFLVTGREQAMFILFSRDVPW